MSLFIDIHVLQTLPPSNPNRDDTGAPKSATFGGVRRMRISSQAIKRAVREDFEKSLDMHLRGIRTKRVPSLLRAEILKRRPATTDTDLSVMVSTVIAWTYLNGSKEKRNAFLKQVNKTPESAFDELDALWFLSEAEIKTYADAIVQDIETDDIAKAFKKRGLNKNALKGEQSVAVALFGRMVASNFNLTVDAACQVAHAIGVGAVENEYDYYTAIDDDKCRSDDADQGAGMIGLCEFASATVYRYATINVDMLRENLGDDNVADRAIELFIDSFVRSMPTGKISTFANRTLPDAVLVQVRNDQPINMSGAFEDPIVAGSKGYAEPAIARFVEFESELRNLTGLKAVESLAAWTTPRGAKFGEVGEQVRLVDLGGATVEAVRGTR